MAKNSIRDYSATNSLNTDIQSIDISEGCSPAGINNAIREVMADLKDVSTGAVALESPAMDSLTVDTTGIVYSSGNVGIGTSSPTAKIQTNTTSAGAATVGLFLNNESDTINTEVRLAFAATANNDIASNRYSYISAINTSGVNGQALRFATNQTGASAVEAMRIDSSGNVGIGTASPAAKCDIAATSGTLFRAFSSGVAQIILGNGGTSNNYFDGDTQIFRSAGAAERMRLDSGGLRVGIPNTFVSGNEKVTIAGGSSSQYDACLVMKSGYATGGTYVNGVYFMNSANGTAGYIAWNGTSTIYSTSSDYRLKENVTADWNATTRLKQLNPVRFNFIADADTTVDGFLAHEVQDIVPEAISGTKDGMRDEEYQVSAATGDIYTPAVEATYDEDGVELTAAVDEVIHSTDVERPEELAEGQQWRETTAAVMGTRSVPDYQGIDQSKLVPLLVKTIQELEARITALEAN